MALTRYTTCMKCSLFIFFLLFFQLSRAQNDFSGLSNWLHNNAQAMGGRAVLMIYKDGKMVFQEAANNMTRKQKSHRRLAAGLKGGQGQALVADFDIHSRERIASCTKWLTAALVMSFVDEGQLSVNDTIGKFLPFMTEAGKGQITLAQCLSHTTGIEQSRAMSGIGEITRATSLEASVREIAAAKMEGEPGKIFHYGNAGLQIAALICEKLGKDSFINLFNKRIAAPCDMRNTDYGPGKVPLAAGGAYSTPNDYMNFLMMILNKGMFNGKKVLSEASVAAMQEDRTQGAAIAYTPSEAKGWGYGFGLWTMRDDTGQYTAVSSPGLFGSFPWIDREKNYAGFLFVFNFKNKGRKALYLGLKKEVEKALEQK
jgi:CubicO group peptidase (beta-lactamase class C family)